MGIVVEIVFIHLLNDFSGSPKVLKEVIKVVTAQSVQGKLYLGSSGDGFLSESKFPIKRYWYCRTRQRGLTLFTYLFSQLVLFVKLLCDRSIAKNAVIYVNTLLPFGAAIYAKLTGRKVVYHVHEISITPVPLRWMLKVIAQMTSSLNIYVSDTHIQALPIHGVPAIRVYNALEDSFIRSALASHYTPRYEGHFNVLLIASLRDYKGVPELMNLATGVLGHHDIRLHLVVNDDQGAIDQYFADKSIPGNLCVYPRTTDPTIFYRQANLVLNLSRVDQCVETFGLTILEAMAFGIPVIVPPLGGPAELVVDGVQGFLVDSYDKTLLMEKLLFLYRDKALCERMSTACRERAAEFSLANFKENIVMIIDQARGAGA